MIFLGIGKKKIASEAIGCKCPGCNSDELMIVDVYARYLGIFWIPFFPLGKKILVTCPKCSHQPGQHTLPQSLVLECEQLKNNSESPRYLFTGLTLTLLIAVFFIFRSFEQSNQKNEYLFDPKAGDIYEFKKDNDRYSLIKIFKVDEDSLYVQFHVDDTGDENRVNTLLQNGNFSKDRIAFSKDEINKKFKDGNFSKISQDEFYKEDLQTKKDDKPTKRELVKPAKHERKVKLKNSNKASPSLK
jgi:hypothetical protein